MSVVRANGLDVAYEVSGAGPPLVILHGATSLGAQDFAAQLPLLRKAFLVHMPDARGHGGTAWDARDGFSHRSLVDDLEGFLDALGLRTTHLLGFSMGAIAALEFAARDPARVRTLVVVGITAEREPRASVARRLMDPDRADPAWAEELERRHAAGQGPGSWRRLLPAIAADIRDHPLLTPAQLHAIDCPTLVAVGDRDPWAPVDHAWRLARQVRAGRLLVVPDCGHEVMVRRAGLFNEALGAFYRATEPVARARAEGPGGTAGAAEPAASVRGAVDTVASRPEDRSP